MLRRERLLFVLHFGIAASAVVLWPFVAAVTDESLEVAIPAIVVLIGLGILLSDARLRLVQARLDQFREGVTRLSGEVADQTELVRSDCERVGFAEGFQRAAELGPFNCVRIFAVSSQEIQAQISASRIVLGECRLLLRGFAFRSPDNVEFHSRMDNVLTTWKAMEERERVGNVRVRRYDFHPTKYVCIFDNKCALVGLYVPAENYAGVAWDDPILFADETKRGREALDVYVRWFDDMYSTSEAEFGPNYFLSKDLPNVPG